MKLIKEGTVSSTLILWKGFRKPEAILVSSAADRLTVMRPEIRH